MVRADVALLAASPSWYCTVWTLVQLQIESSLLKLGIQWGQRRLFLFDIKVRYPSCEGKLTFLKRVLRYFVR